MSKSCINFIAYNTLFLCRLFLYIFALEMFDIINYFLIYIISNLPLSLMVFRDLVHRQTACAAIKHMALGVYGFGCEDALIHLLNHVWPNVFETSPHLVQAFMDAVDGLRVALGPIKILQYTLQVRNYYNCVRSRFLYISNFFILANGIHYL